MCGLAGIIGSEIRKNDMEMFRDLLYLSALRGTDSTGVAIASLGKKKWFEVKKRTIPASAFIRTDSLEKYPMLEDYAADLFMGHCRDATVGIVTEANAHPFSMSKLIGMHNGTLLDAKYRGSTKTDSEEMFTDMNVRGVKPVLEDLHRSSAFAIAVYHKNTSKLSLARNKKRPLWIGVNTERRVISWASEEYMLHLAAERNHCKLAVYYLQADHIYTIDAAKIKKGDVVSWECEPIEYKLPETPVVPKVWVPDTVTSTAVDMYSESYYDQLFNQDYSVANQASSIMPLTFTQDDDKYNRGSAVMELNDPIPFGNNKKTKAADDGPKYENEHPACCICEKELYGEKLEKAECVTVGGAFYYSCDDCNEEIARRARAQADLRRPPLDPDKMDDQVSTH